jgi:hypothetical protein
VREAFGGTAQLLLAAKNPSKSTDGNPPTIRSSLTTRTRPPVCSLCAILVSANDIQRYWCVSEPLQSSLLVGHPQHKSRQVVVIKDSIAAASENKERHSNTVFADSTMAGPLNTESSKERPTSSRDSPERGKKRASMSTVGLATVPSLLSTTQTRQR